jgi:hypothetical protein
VVVVPSVGFLLIEDVAINRQAENLPNVIVAGHERNNPLRKGSVESGHTLERFRNRKLEI